MLDDLKVLECSLRDQLHAHLGRVLPFQVQCIFKDGVLWVLAQHAQEIVIDTEETFRVLEKTLQAEQPDRQLPVKLYLRKAGDKKPYSTENFTIYPSIKDALPGEAAPSIDITELHGPTELPGPTELRGQSEPLESSSEIHTDFVKNTSSETYSEHPLNPPIETNPIDTSSSGASLLVEPDSSIHTDFLTTTGSTGSANAVASPTTSDSEVNRAKEILDRLALGTMPSPVVDPEYFSEADANSSILQYPKAESAPEMSGGSAPSDSLADDAVAFASDIENSFAYAKPEKAKPNLKNVLLAGGIGLGLLSGGAYGLSRPCVLGACPQLQESQSLAEKSLNVINGEATGKQILEAQSALHQSLAQFKSVPLWSSSHGKAQEDLKKYADQAAMLDITVEGMKKADRASHKTVKQPISQTTWKESKKLWEGAISDLQKVSSNSRAYPLAQQKLVEYQQKLEKVNQNITSEVNSDKILANVKNLGTITTAKQAENKTLEDWQASQKSWTSFNEQIAEIPPDVTAYAEAQKLLKDYQPQITAVNEKLGKEKKNGDIFDKAKADAAEAKKLAEAKKPEESLASWNRAISTLQNIPKDSIYITKAEALTTEYAKSMKQTEVTVVGEKKAAQAGESLKKICEGTLKVCSYKVAIDKISVTLIPEYAKTVRQRASDANKEADRNAQAGLLKHVESLGDALQSVSTTAEIPLQLFSDSGKLLQIYSPPKS
jgi:hypothetical protein